MQTSCCILKYVNNLLSVSSDVKMESYYFQNPKDFVCFMLSVEDGGAQELAFFSR